MKRKIVLTFLGTRGEIAIRSRHHRRHSSLLVQRAAARVMIDCGADWRHRLKRVAPTAILLTHAHPDHAAGLKNGSPCPVYATRTTWAGLSRYPIRDRRIVSPRRPLAIGGLTFKPFLVEHSLRAPAVGFRVSAGRCAFVYVTDVVAIPNIRRAFSGATLYIGDGARIRRPLVRKKKGARIGHAAIAAQLAWCETQGIRRAIFTHCGSEVVRAAAPKISALVRALGRAHNVDARIAYDGERVFL
jgi:phosphoribosyl 1,2-cyclic phosphodiesterase